MQKQIKKRHKRLRNALISLFVLLFLVGFWAFSNFTFRVTHTSITSPKVQNPVKIVLLTDLHGMSFGGDNSFLVSAVSREDPDLIVFCGDMYSSTDLKKRSVVLSLAGELTQLAPVYSVPGEHDRSEEFYAQLDQVGVKVLDYDYAPVTVGNTKLTLYGIDNAYFSPTFDLHNAFSAPSTETYNILLAHIPNLEAYEAWGPDLVLAGDTHGGVVQLPWWGPLEYQGTWFPRAEGVDPIYDQGLFSLGDTQMYVSAGLGWYPLPVRLFNRPELAVITVEPEHAK